MGFLILFLLANIYLLLNCVSYIYIQLHIACHFFLQPGSTLYDERV